VTAAAIDEREALRQASFVLHEEAVTIEQTEDQVGRIWWHCVVWGPAAPGMPPHGRIGHGRGCGLSLEEMLRDVELGAKHRAAERRARRRYNRARVETD
jgi:hypothetical protein